VQSLASGRGTENQCACRPIVNGRRAIGVTCMSPTLELLADVAAVLLWIAGTLLALLLTGCTFVFMPVAFTRTRRKGYGPLVPGLISSAGVLVWLGGTIAAPAVATDSFSVIAFWFTVGGPAACLAIVFAGATCLPRRRRRIFGPRRAKFPFEAAGWAIMLIGGIPLAAFMVYSLWPPRTVKEMFEILIMAAVGFALFAWLGSMLVLRGRLLASQGTLESELAKDPRPPVLYIRSFERERDAFVFGDKSKYGRYARRALDSSKIQWVAITFEEYLGNAIRPLVGPFVALGSPEDHLAPMGAARTYTRDEEWQDDFDRLVRSASAILVEVGRSQNLRWEFKHIRENGLQQRLFLITRHASTSRAARWPWLGTKIKRLQGMSLLSWGEFSTELGKLGYRLDIDDPGPGTVLTFDADSVATVITSGADLPDDFVNPIAAQIAAAAASA
jgi:hypothetical protein